MQFVKARAIQVVTDEGWKWAVTSYGVTTHGDHLPSTVARHHETLVKRVNGDRKSHKEAFPHLYQ